MSLSCISPIPENFGSNFNTHLPHLPTMLEPIFPIALKFEEVVYKVKLEGEKCKEKTILHGVSGIVCPGEILAMLGPSGSGKTTLLTALGGRLRGKLLSGKITYNGQQFTGGVKRRIGFVAQDDVLYPHLTVFETLFFTALLRLPSTMAHEHKVGQVERVISELGLTRVQNSIVGGPLVRGISGGEKKRVSIGQEMLINPSLILLDEPTSGLDSTTALRILSILKAMADGGRTVVTTIHQPSSRVYHMFSKVVLLSEGRPIYYGPGSTAVDHFSSVGFSTTLTINPADLLLDLASGIGPESKHAMEQGENMEKEKKQVRDALILAYENNISIKLKSDLCTFDATTYNWNKDASNVARKDIKGEQWCTSWWHQFKVLLQRGMKERRFEAFNRLRIFQVLSVAILGGLLWWQTPESHIEDRIALIFFFTVFWGFYPLYNAVFTFPQERRMLIKERTSGMYKLSSYFLARTFGDLPLELALPTAFVFIIYWMGGLKPDPIIFILSLIIVLFNVLVAQSLGLAFGAILMDIKPATTLASVTTLVFLIAGGYYVQQIPPFIVWLKYLSYSYYCYKLLLGVQYHENDTYPCLKMGKWEWCKVVDVPAVKSMGLNHLWVDVCIMGLMLVGYRIIAYLALQRVRMR
ncbi:ABC transporter G family member 14-like [Silene latifolia]|uniref:ABC transporter G family member 14-like n=1 Tax=Silene latifolia TaxID=37657 RepID=UPI003D7806C0